MQYQHSFYAMHVFAFNEWKSQANHEKHGIDFINARKPWVDLYFIGTPAKVSDEPRVLVISRISDQG